MEWWLKEYGQNPDQVRALPAFFVARVPHIAEARRYAEEKKRTA